MRWWPHTTDERIASFRLRCLRIVEHLAGQGMDAALYRPGDAAPSVLVLSKRYDAGSLEQALQLRRTAGTRVLLDLCDNHFYFEGDDPGLAARAESLRQAVCRVDRVVAASQALAEVVRQQCPTQPQVVVIPDAAEPPSDPAPDLMSRWREPRAEGRLLQLDRRLGRTGVPLARRLVWFGNHGSAGTDGGMADLLLIREALEAAHARAPVSLSVISNDERKFRRLFAGWRLPGTYLPWHAHTFSRALRLHSLCVVPVGLNPFTRCKTNNRVATALLHGLNVVATRIPGYDEFGEQVVLDDWGFGLGAYLDDAQRRRRDIEAGRQRLAQHYSLAAIAARWRAVTSD